MSKIVLTNCVVKVDTVDLSDHVNQVTVTETVNEVETSAFGNSNVTRVGGLRDSSISLTFHQNFAAGEVYATLKDKVGSIGTVQVIPNGTAISATNPSISLEVLYTEMSHLDGSIGELSTASVTWPANSITKATA
jgi:hypothetical protein